MPATARRDPGTPFRRLVWSEVDELPGLVADRYDDVLVLQALTLSVTALVDKEVDSPQNITRGHSKDNVPISSSSCSKRSA